MILEQHTEVEDEEYEENGGLVPLDLPVPGHSDEDDKVDGKNDRVPRQGQPIQFDGLRSSQTGTSSNAESIKQHGADYRSQAHFR